MSDTTAYSADVTLPGGVSVVARIYVPKDALPDRAPGDVAGAVTSGVALIVGKLLNVSRCGSCHWYANEDEGTRCELAPDHDGDHVNGFRRWTNA